MAYRAVSVSTGRLWRPRGPVDASSPFRVPRFEFLQPWHQYNAYYEFKKQFFLQKEGADSAQVPVHRGAALGWPTSGHGGHRPLSGRRGLLVLRLLLGGTHLSLCCLQLFLSLGIEIPFKTAENCHPFS